MSKIDRAALELMEMDDMAMGKSTVHSLHPVTKLIVTAVYLVCVTSYSGQDLSGLVPMVIYQAFLFPLSGIPFGTCFRKIRAVIPLLLAFGVPELLLDRGTALVISGVAISKGAISFTVFVLKGILCVSAAFLLTATTPLDRLCAGLRKLHIPSSITTLFLLTFRYISVMMEELSNMNIAYSLRAPGQRGINYKVWGSFLGQLLLRSVDRAQELYESMLLRGFDGEMRYAEERRFNGKDASVTVFASALILAARFINLSLILGGLLVRGV